MTYDELKQIAKPHIRENGELPSNSFLLLTQLHIPFKTQKQCEEDYGGKMTPLYNSPAFLAVDSKGNKTVYFNSNVRYWNFYIFHEIAHYILGHENDSPQNEMDADMLGCILAAPVENLPSNLKSARDLSVLCQIPIDKSEMYWEEIRSIFSKNRRGRWKSTLILILCMLFVILLLYSRCVYNNIPEKTQENNANNVAISDTDIPSVPPSRPKEDDTFDESPSDDHFFSEERIVNSQENPPEDIIKPEKTPSVVLNHENKDMSRDDNIETAPSNEVFYYLPTGTRYHRQDCQYVKYKSNSIPIAQEDVGKSNLEPCKKCTP